MFDKLFGKRPAVHPEGGILSMTELRPHGTGPEFMLSMPEISQMENEQGGITKVAKISVTPITLYQRIVYKLDILIPTKKAEEEILIPPGTYLQRVIYGKFKKLRVIKDPRYGLPQCLVEEKDDVQTYRVFQENGNSSVKMMDTGSPFIRKWDNLTLILLLFTASVTPFETAFVQSSEVIDILFLVNRVVDLCFLYDMTIQVRTPYRDRNTGALVNDFNSVAKNYLKSWFALDFISIFPFELITWGQTSASTTNLAVLRLLRLARLLKLLRIFRASRKLQRFRVNIRIKYSHIQLYTYTAILIFLIHWLACGYKLTAEKTTPEDPDTWIEHFADYKNVTTDQLHTIDIYFLALYWSASTVTLVGSSFYPIQPVTTLEWGYAVIVNLISYSLVVFIISNLTDLNVHANKAKRLHELKVDKYLQMFHSLYLNPNIKFKVNEYLNDQFALSKESEYQDLIKALPQQYNGIINMEIFLPFLTRIPFLEPFMDIEPNLMIDLCRNIEMIAMPPNSLLFHRGVKGIYLLEKGIVAIDGKIYIRGDVIGETVLRAQPKKNEGRCLTNVVAQLLPKDALEACLLKHRKLRYYARRWTSWELARRYIRAYTRLYYLASIRGSLMQPPMLSKRGSMDENGYDDIDMAVMEHIEEYGYF